MSYQKFNLNTELRKVVQGKKTKVSEWILLRSAAEALLAARRTKRSL
jgi:hypothetical protein